MQGISCVYTIFPSVNDHTAYHLKSRMRLGTWSHSHMPPGSGVGVSWPDSSLSETDGRAGTVITHSPFPSFALGWCVGGIGYTTCFFKEGPGTWSYPALSFLLDYGMEVTWASP